MARAAEGLLPFAVKPLRKLNMGFLVGGNTRGFKLEEMAVAEVIAGLKKAALSLDAGVMVSSSSQDSAGDREFAAQRIFLLYVTQRRSLGAGK